MIRNYLEFINESLDFLLLESNVIYSDKFRKTLLDIDSPISKKLLEVENNDYDVKSNYFNLSGDKNDKIEFISDKKAQDILKDIKEEYKFVGSGGWLKHKSTNDNIFEKLGYSYEEGTEPYKPESEDVGIIIKKVTSDVSGKVYAWIKWNSDKGEGVYNMDKIQLIDSLSKLMNQVWSTNRQEIKVGRGVKAILKSAGLDDFSSKEYEDFVNVFKSTIDKYNDIFSYFDVVSGKDIYEYYRSNRLYKRSGTLGSSCMINADQSWLKIYTDNPDNVSMVILRAQENTDTIIGRAILWTIDSGEKFMDRIYFVNDSDLNLFREYAMKNGWFYKRSNTYENSSYAVNSEGEVVELDLKVTLRDGYDSFPYMDTLKYYNVYKHYLTCDDSEYDYGVSVYELTNTNGTHADYSCDTCNGDEYVNCPNCDGGSINCEDCNGSGNVSCSTCDGTGELECSSCEGTGKNGEDDCEDCGGRGTFICYDCDNNGQVDCDNCGGDGSVSCYECEGEGHRSCPECQ
jgi:hypothetical protein